MQIKQELPQFLKQPVILIAAGKQHGLIYLAKNKEINKLKEIRIEKDIYSDREGHFARKSSQLDISSGSVYEDVGQDKRIKDFLKAIEAEIKKHPDIKTVYCFCPDYMKNLFKNLINKYFNTSKMFLGNYTDEHPFVLLEKIKAA